MSVIAHGQIEKALKEGDKIARLTLKNWEEHENYKPSPSDITEFRRRASIFERTQMQLYYEMLDRNLRPIRLIVAVSYSIGLSALLWPALTVFGRVSAVLAKSFGF
jgi:hypothetical protein